MPQFSYRAKKGPKEVVNGVLEAESRNAAIARLVTQNLFPLRVEERSSNGPLKERLSLPFWAGRKMGVGDVAVFERQLADLLEAGLPLLRALEVLEAQTQQRAMKDVLAGLIEDVKSGAPLSQAMGKFPKTFNAMTVSMMHAGEVGGMLNTVLARLADFSEKDQETRGKIQSAMAYPAFLSLMGIVTVIVLMLFVIPKLLPVFDEIGQALPLPTRMLLAVSFFCRDYGWVLGGVAALAAVAFSRQIQTAEGRKALDEAKMKAPVFGPLVQKSEIGRFSRTLAALLGNGVPMLQSLKISAEGVGNVILRQEIGKVFEDIARGQQLGECMKKSALFPAFAVNMIVVGEQGGQLERALDKVAMAYEKDVDRSIRFLTTLLEPLMILLMGSIVGFIVMAMLLPIFSINLAAQ